MKKSFFFKILFIAFFCHGYLLAQVKYGSIVIEADYSSRQEVPNAFLKGKALSKTNSEHTYGVEEAVVIILTNKGDTLKYGSTDERGFCTLRNIPYGKYKISIEYLGFLPMKLDVNHTSSNTKVYVKMEEGGFLLDEIKVQGNIPLLIAKGDTLVVNPRAVQTQQGAAAIEIIKQVPGIEITSSGSIIAFGELLRRTYVGGSTLFGRNVLSGLINLDADLVKNIKFYDEEEIVSITNGVTHKRKVRVMNIETTRQLLSSTTGHLFAGIGKDLKDGNKIGHKLRHKAAGEFNMFTTKLIVKGSALHNNVGLAGSKVSDFVELTGKRSGSEKELSRIGISAEYNNREDNNVFKSGSTTRVSYNYLKDETVKDLLTERKYFPVKNIGRRIYSDRSENITSESGHKIDVFHSNSFKERRIRHYYFQHSMSFDDNRFNNFHLQENTSDISSIKILDKENIAKHTWNISEKASVSTKKGHSLNIGFNTGNNDGNVVQSVENSEGETVIKSSPEGRNIAVNAVAGIQLFGKVFNADSKDKFFSTTWRLNLSTDYQYGKIKEYRYNMTEVLNPYLDSLSSYFYTNNHWKNSAEIMLVTGSGKKNIIGGVEFAAGISKVKIQDDDRITAECANKNYVMPHGRFLIRFFGKIFVRYTLTPSVPALEQVRTYVNDDNPLFISVGNKNLDYSLKHNISVNIVNADPFSANTNIIRLYLKYAYEQNAIVPYSVYNPEGGEIPEVPGYKMLPGATFSSFRNVNNNIASSIDLWYTTRVSAIRSKLQMNIGGMYNKRPSYVQNKLNVTDTYSGKFHFNTYTSYKGITLELNSTTEYTESRNTIKNNHKYFNQDIKAITNITLLDMWYIKGTYIFSLNKPVGGSEGYTNRNNILNASAGVKLFKGRLSAGISVFDIFDRSTDFSAMLYEDYVQNTWTPTFGRYISFDVLFNLRKNKYK